MANQHNTKTDPDAAAIYQVRITGHLGSEWQDWFGCAAISLEDNGDTLLSGLVLDQAALHGLFKKLRDMGITLVSVNRAEPDQARSADRTA